MAFINEMRYVERLQFFNGQRLFASDLQGLEAFNRDMRWLHNQSLHQPGVGSGFAINGKKGDREVTIFPGYAIDALGREIVLTEKHVEPVPPVADNGCGKSVFYYLTVSYPDDSELEETETREGICLPRGVVRLREEPVFCWVLLEGEPANPKDHTSYKERLRPSDPRLSNEITNGIRIILAQAEVSNCQLKQDLSTAQRRNARPAQQPYVACGATSPDKTDWRPWNGGAGVLGLQAKVNTTTAHFRTIPCYSAHIVGDRFFTGNPNLVFDGFINIVNPQRTEFELRVLMPQMKVGELNVNNMTATNLDLVKNNWHVVWMGVEG